MFFTTLSSVPYPYFLLKKNLCLHHHFTPTFFIYFQHPPPLPYFRPQHIRLYQPISSFARNLSPPPHFRFFSLHTQPSHSRTPLPPPPLPLCPPHSLSSPIPTLTPTLTPTPYVRLSCTSPPLPITPSALFLPAGNASRNGPSSPAFRATFPCRRRLVGRLVVLLRFHSALSRCRYRRPE